MGEEKRQVSYEEMRQMANSRLLDYMDLKGIRNKGTRAFRCPNKSAHAHGDANPSGHIFQGPDGSWKWQCHACGAGQDTIAMACIVDGLPTNGPGFFKQTLPKIASALGMDVVMEKPSPLYEIYHKIQKALKPVPKFRNIPEDAQRLYGIGTLDYESARKLVHNMPGASSSGFSSGRNKMNTFMEEIFTKRIVFTVKDAAGNAITFSGRKTDKDDPRTKWYNGPNNDRMFQKSRTLYGFDIACRSMPADTRTVYVVEGYIDAIRMHLNGIMNTVSVMSSKVTKEQALAIKSLTPLRVVVALDTDPESSKTTEKAFGSGLILSKLDLDVFIKRIPEVGHDPDSYIEEFGVEKFKKIPEIPLVEYAMIEMVRTKDDRNQVERYLEWLAENYTSKMLIEATVRKLSEYTGFSYETLRDEMDNVLISVADENNAELRRKIDEACDTAKGLPVLSAATHISKLSEELSLAVGKRIVSPKRQIETIHTVKHHMSEVGYNQLILDMPRFEDMVKIPKRKGMFVVLAANPNVGKSTFMRQAAYNILVKNDDASVIYHTIDDDFEDVTAALASLAGGAPLNIVKFPKMFDSSTTASFRDKVDRGYAWIDQRINERRLRILDVNDATNAYTLAANVESMCRAIDSHVVVIIDSLHSLIDVSIQSIQDPRVNAMVVAQSLSQMGINTRSTILAIAEFNRNRRIESGYKPTIANISETVKIEYVCKVGMTLHDPRQYDSETSYIWKDRDAQYGDLPMLELIVEKNKTGPKGGSIWLKHHQFFSSIKEAKIEEEVEAAERERARRSGERRRR